MADALIGYTGFVGGTLLRQRTFDAQYRSTNIGDIAGRSFDMLICAGAPAEKWRANQDPEGDLASLAKLTTALSGVRAREVVLISTVDVYPVPVDVDESAAIDPAAGHPYGQHRLALERFIQDRFESRVIRLPGLFGSGLKKNVIYDLLHGNQVDKINPAAVFQFYDMDRLWTDVERARSAKVDLVNFATEPVVVGDVARIGFGVELPAGRGGASPRYDVRSRHASLFGGRGGYLMTAESVLGAIAAFVRNERRER